MFSHVVLGSNDLDRSKRFYDALFAALGAQGGAFNTKGRLVYTHDGGRLLLTAPVNGEAATPGNGVTIGLAMADPAQADAWHAAGVGNGGTAVEDPPGWRKMAHGRFYLAYLRDPDGNKLCGRHRQG